MTLSVSSIVEQRDEQSHIFQTPTSLLLHALGLLLRLPKILKHQFRLLLTLQKIPRVYLVSCGKIYVVAILPLIEHKSLKWSCD